MLGDQVYMARVDPTFEAVNDRAQWEFYAGGSGADAKWVKGDVGAAEPLVNWENHTGVVTMTYHPTIKKCVRRRRRRRGRRRHRRLAATSSRALAFVAVVAI
jgi:hypothetical protein